MVHISHIGETHVPQQWDMRLTRVILEKQTEEHFVSSFCIGRIVRKFPNNVLYASKSVSLSLWTGVLSVAAEGGSCCC